MRKEDVLKDLIHTGNIGVLKCIKSLMALTPPATDDSTGKMIGQVWRDRTKVYVLDRNSSRQVVEGVKHDQPMFRPTTPLVIDATWGLDIIDPIETTFGKLLFNLICIYPAFGNKLGYINRDLLDLGGLDDIIATRLQSKPKDGEPRQPQYIYTDELVKYQKHTKFLEQIAMLVNISATPKSVVAPPGVDEFRASIRAKYEGRLHDPVVAVQFETEMKAFDDAWLRDDPGYKIFLGGKITGTARKRMFLTGGIQLSFDKKTAKVVEDSLNNGWGNDPDTLVTMFNDARLGSLSRGSDTVKGGVTAKQLLRPVMNYSVLRDFDCGSRVGLRRRVTKAYAGRMVGRYLTDGTRMVLIENNEIANNYVGKDVVVRSPGYCKSKGETYCSVCAGRKLSENSESLSIAVTEISNIVLYALMKLMHGVEYSLATVELEDVMS